MSGRTLILLRHAKSDWSGNELDLGRPMAIRGQRQAPDAGRWLNINKRAGSRARTPGARRYRDIVRTSIEPERGPIRLPG
jgi:phosphohistidine phosphatase